MSDSTELLEVLGGSSLEAAPRLLGALVRRGEVAVRLTEVEAYAGAQDPGSHAYRGATPRNQVMFGPAGRLYVYFTYGMHHCANIVCGPDGVAAAVLMRAGEVVAGHEVARARRPGVRDRDLARGPARLCRTLGVDLADNGTDLLDPAAEASGLRLLPSETEHPGPVATGPRVGLRHAADRPWRFWLEGEPTVSAYRPAGPRRGRARQVDPGPGNR